MSKLVYVVEHRNACQLKLAVSVASRVTTQYPVAVFQLGWEKAGCKRNWAQSSARRPNFGHNLARKRHKIGHSLERERPSRARTRERPKFGHNSARERNEIWAQFCGRSMKTWAQICKKFTVHWLFANTKIKLVHIIM